MSILLLSSCSNRQQEETLQESSSVLESVSTVESTELEKTNILSNKNLNGQMGKLNVSFSFLDDDTYREKVTTVGTRSNMTRLTEGTYVLVGDEVKLTNHKDFTYYQYIDSPNNQVFQMSFEEDRDMFERMYVTDNQSILLTYGLDKDGIDTAPDDAFKILEPMENTLESIGTEKKTLVQVKDTSNLFMTVGEFGDWVLVHMASSRYSIRNQQETVDIEGDVVARYLVNVYAKGYESAPGTTVAIDFEGNMYTDAIIDDQGRRIHPASDWDETLDTDIAAGEIVAKETPEERLLSLVGIWAMVPSDYGFEILNDKQFEFLPGPGAPKKVLNVELANIDEDGNLHVELEGGARMDIKVIDDETIEIGTDEKQILKKQYPPR